MAGAKEAQARVKINKLLEDAGWRFEDSDAGRANIQLEAGVKYGDLGNDFENHKSGIIDFLLLDKDRKPLVVVEAKKESIDPLAAKEQARRYTKSIGARFIILSNGNLHYLWDTKFGNPEIISHFPSQESITQHIEYQPDSAKLAESEVDENYVIASQMPNYAADPDFRNQSVRTEFLKRNNLTQLRPYQVQAIKALQESAGKGNQRFLFEMATGTGKTLISAAIIKLFLCSDNAQRILFLVDRLELEQQARKAFVKYLGKDYPSVIYKESADSWADARVVVSTIQTFLSGDRYRQEFNPTDFQLVISDEAHRSIGGNSRAVFEYFVGYKLGLTATPKNYLRGFDAEDTHTFREYERRLLHDTYKTFGCKPGSPTFSYDLEQGANEKYLIKPVVADIRTEVTTQLFSDEGYAVYRVDVKDDANVAVFGKKDFELNFFNDETNTAMCRALLEHGLYDPVAEEMGVKLFGKTLVFAVSQNHALRLADILNRLALKKWPDEYGQSDFAMQVTSQVAGAQQMTVKFANNRLGTGTAGPAGYDSSKCRVCVTVGMMTTGYDCQDILNIALMRPVFSPTDFVQIKGRGTRKWLFEYDDGEGNVNSKEKDKFKFFDFFANCEYFEKDFNYDEKIPLPVGDGEGTGRGDGGKKITGPYDLASDDRIETVKETADGVIMRIDREGFGRIVREEVVGSSELKTLWDNGDIQGAGEFVKKNVFNKPGRHLDLEKIGKILNADHRITTEELLEFAFYNKERLATKDELVELEWEKFVKINKVDHEHFQSVKKFFMAYSVDEEVRDIIKSGKTGQFNFCDSFSFADYEELNSYKTIVPHYIQDYALRLMDL